MTHSGIKNVQLINEKVVQIIGWIIINGKQQQTENLKKKQIFFFWNFKAENR